MTENIPPPGPGWHSDPQVPGRQRWWTGTEWGPVQQEQREEQTRTWRNHVPVALFALGCSVAAAAVVLIWQPLFAGGVRCGSLFAPIAQTTTIEGSGGFNEFNAVVCQQARIGRIGVIVVLAVLALALIVGAFVYNKRLREEQGVVEGASAREDAPSDATPDSSADKTRS